MTNFGRLLRTFRGQCHNPIKGGKLSQQWLARLLGEEMGASFSGATISYWESGESKIHADDRPLLTSLLKVLYKNGGLKTLFDAETLLEAGNYRALSEEEKRKVFPKDLLEELAEPTISESMEKTTPIDPSPGFPSIFDFQSLASEAKEASSPLWSLTGAALMRRISDRIGAWDWIRLFVWLLLWTFAYILLSPVLQWPFSSRQIAWESIIIYVGASFILPLCIGSLTNTDNNPVWKGREKAPQIIVRIYSYQGAFMGFHVGYFSIFFIHLVTFYFHFSLRTWLQFGLAGFPLFMGAIGAHLVPDNLWRAYRELSLRFWVIIVAFIVFGPFWGWFFFQFYSWLLSPILGAVIIITALIFTALLTKYEKVE